MATVISVDAAERMATYSALVAGSYTYAGAVDCPTNKPKYMLPIPKLYVRIGSHINALYEQLAVMPSFRDQYAITLSRVVGERLYHMSCSSEKEPTDIDYLMMIARAANQGALGNHDVEECVCSWLQNTGVLNGLTRPEDLISFLRPNKND